MEFTAEKQRQGQELLQTLIQKSWDDETFKNQLVNNPKDAIESVLGKSMTIPEGKKFIVVDQTDENTVFINIPAKPDLSNFELTQEQLEAIAGGKTSYDGLNPFVWIGIGAHEVVNLMHEACKNGYN